MILAIEEFNNQLSAEGVILVKKIDYYIPRLPKRNGKAKTDMPCMIKIKNRSWYSTKINWYQNYIDRDSNKRSVKCDSYKKGVNIGPSI